MDSEEHKKEEVKQEVNHIKHKSNSLKCMRTNPWIVSTIVFAILILVLLFSGVSSGHHVSEKNAADSLVGFYESQGISGLEVSSMGEEHGLYKINLTYQGQEVPFYVTKDGYLTGNTLVPLLTDLSSNSSSTSTQTQQEVPKADKPKVELFVWGYCPYGVQAQGPMSEVASLLKDYADFTLIPYYDGHGEFEKEQDKVESCIQQIVPDKYWDYSARFVSEIYPNCSTSRTIDCDKAESTKLMDSLGIDSSAIWSCVETQGEDLFNAAASYASQNNVKGSPTIIINGVQVNVARDAESIKSAVCSAFTNPPEVCGTALNSTTGTASGNC